MSNSVLGWHFTSQTLRDGRPIPPVGEWLRHKGRVVLCKCGLHMSRRIIDALQYAPGPFIHRVEGRGVVQETEDKLVCRKRRILRSVDGEAMLLQFARECAMSVLHLWNAPDVVRQYLETRDEALKPSVRQAIQDAPWSNALSAALFAVFNTTYDSAFLCAQDTTRALVKSGEATLEEAVSRLDTRLEAMFWAEAEEQTTSH